MKRFALRVGTVLAAGLLVVLSLAVPAYAATNAGISGGILVVIADPGVANDIFIAESGGQIMVRDNADVLVPGANCAPDPDPHVVWCLGIPNSIQVHSGDLDDRIRLDPTVFRPSKLFGAAGKDIIIGGSGSDQIFGGLERDQLFGENGRDELYGDGGDDDLRGGPAVDTLYGSFGRDRFDGGPDSDTMYGMDGADTAFSMAVFDGADIFFGGPGTDEMSYAARVAAVTVSLDGVANDGIPGEGDQIHTDVENLRGGNNSDTLTGSAVGNYLRGGGGHDILDGLDGNDSLDGELGDDTLRGGLQNDFLAGGPGPALGTDADGFDGGPGVDEVNYLLPAGRPEVRVHINGLPDDGGPGESDNVLPNVENVVGTNGDDTIIGDGGPNYIHGMGGNDLISGDAGNDTIVGGDGDDRLFGRDGSDILRGNVGDDLLSDLGDLFVDDLNGGPHVAGDTCDSTPPDAEADCEI